MSKIINDEDIYCDFASLKYGRKITKADKAERQFGKCSILGLGYQMGRDRFIDTVKTQMGITISGDDAWKTVNLYRTTYFNVPKLWAHAHDLLPLISSGKIGCLWFAPFIKVVQNALVLPSGLRIQYPNLRQVGDEWIYDDASEIEMAQRKNRNPNLPTLYGGKIVENICQALAGELCKEAIERAMSVDLTPVAQIHDEIICVEKENDMEPFRTADEAASLLKACMEKAPKWLPTLKLKAEVGVGSNWGNAKV